MFLFKQNILNKPFVSTCDLFLHNKRKKEEEKSQLQQQQQRNSMYKWSNERILNEWIQFSFLNWCDVVNEWKAMIEFSFILSGNRQ